uniref:B box-type domain-containing protein n=1 Tax=Steinernema glaseri TaxID=37863 RepID=A0A1I8ANB9_9BILA
MASVGESLCGPCLSSNRRQDAAYVCLTCAQPRFDKDCLLCHSCHYDHDLAHETESLERLAKRYTLDGRLSPHFARFRTSQHRPSRRDALIYKAHVTTIKKLGGMAYTLVKEVTSLCQELASCESCTTEELDGFRKKVADNHARKAKIHMAFNRFGISDKTEVEDQTIDCLLTKGRVLASF